ncbi:MAG: DUF4347 domain-containing protein [Burkholderiales bacterium]
MFEELESRLLMSADLDPLKGDALLAVPALQGAEFRALADDGSAVTRSAVGAVQATTEIVFVDPRVPDRAQLLAGLAAQSDGRRFELVELDPGCDGVAQVTEALRGRIQVDAIHFVTHGADGAVQLGGTWLDAKALAANTAAVAAWGDSLTQDADILFYGCDLASGASGRALMQWIAELTRGDVAASTDATGAAQAGGDWTLEAEVGAIETRVAIAAEARAAWAQVLGGVPTGGETPVNTTTSSGQDAPAVATAPDGRAVIAWVSNNQDGNGRAIVARLFAPSGAPSSGEFVVNTTSSNDQLEPAVAMDGNGNFVVAWSGEGAGDADGVFFRRFDAAGNALDAVEQRVNVGVAGNQSNPDVAMELNGDFAVVWQSDEFAPNTEIWLQRYAFGGGALGGAILVSASGAADTNPSVAMDDDGDLVVSWETFGQDAAGSAGIYARRYDNAGNSLDATPFLVNTTTAGDQARPDVAMDANGNFFVVWDGNGPGDTQGVFGQRYTNAGTPQGVEFKVNSQGTDAQTRASASLAADGRAAVAWDSANQDGSATGVYRQEYLASGAPDGGELLVNTTVAGDQRDAAVAMDDAGGYWVAWSGNGAGPPADSGGVWARRFVAAATGTIAGTVLNDANGDAVVGAEGGFAGAIVTLYRDDGGGTIGGGDAYVASTMTDGSGNYSFGGLTSGTYYVVVDSRSLGSANVWAEQTFGVAGSALGAGFTVANGALYGGRDAAASDDAATLMSAEHVVKVALAGGGGAAGVDFGFSLNAITSDRDGDDDLGSGDRSVQGSLRQFIHNANVTAGVQAANFSIGGGGLQTINLAAALPGITEAVVIDGGTQGLYAGLPLIELNGAGAGAATGLVLQSGSGGSTIRALAINRFSGSGIVVAAGSNGNSFLANHIGTNAAGTAIQGNGVYGIEVQGGANTIAGNLISGNFAGVLLTGTGATGNRLEGNSIGTDVTDTVALGNISDGVRVASGAYNNTIGGTGGAEGNLIAFNGQDGVVVAGAGTGNAILGNAMRANGTLPNHLGIELGADGVTANDGPGDADSGANGLQNFPQLYAAGLAGGNLTVQFGFASTASSAFRIELFASAAPDASGFGEGARYLGAFTVNTDSSGLATATSFTLVGAGVAAGEVITATATANNGAGSTSEFSNAVVAGSRTLSGTIYDDANGNANVSDDGAGAVFANATNAVDLYLDDGDGAIDAGDLFIDQTSTDVNGAYLFTGLGNGTYYVVVDSRALTGPGLWAEQTYGAFEAASGAGFTSVGMLYGGRERLGQGTSDDASSLATAEHVIKYSIAGGDATGVDFGFASSVITNALDGDDDPNPDRSVQGSLRQFIVNANALAGVQTSAFHIGAPGNAYSIAVTGSALPAITDAVILDAWTQGGGAYSGPPLIDLDGGAAGAGANGLTITGGGTTVRGFAIHDFAGHGVAIAGGGGNTIANNRIGTDATGMFDRGNGQSGVFVDNSAGNVIGGATPAQGNVISGNALDGVTLSGPGSTGNLVAGNLVGLNAAGTAAIANGAAGVDIEAGAWNNTVGAISATVSNVISGNQANGIEIDGAGTTGNVVIDNYVGLSAAGDSAIGNALSGIAITGAAGNTVGGTVLGASNVISGNNWDGVALASANGNVVLGNYIGTDWTGAYAVANREDGIYVLDGANNQIGGAGGTGNLVSGNLMNGVELAGTSTGNLVQGNFVGVNAGGTAALGNGLSGVMLNGASGNVIGAGNVLSGNQQDGITIFGASNNRIESSLIGTDWTGTYAIANREDGVYLQDGSNNTIGGGAPGAGNLISGNSWSGVSLAGTGSGNRVQGNYIGTDGTGNVAIGNAQAGVYLSITGPTMVGGTAADESNRIAYNGWDGIAIMAGTGHSVLGNEIHSNVEQAIDILDDGITPNDAGDGDAGPNDRQNYPVLFGAAINGPNVTISGALNGNAGNYLIEFYANATPTPGADGSGHGEAQRYLGATTVTIASGDAAFTTMLAASVAPGEIVSATATNLATGSTSELALNCDHGDVDFLHALPRRDRQRRRHRRRRWGGLHRRDERGPAAPRRRRRRDRLRRSACSWPRSTPPQLGHSSTDSPQQYLLRGGGLRAISGNRAPGPSRSTRRRRGGERSGAYARQRRALRRRERLGLGSGTSDNAAGLDHHRGARHRALAGGRNVGGIDSVGFNAIAARARRRRGRRGQRARAAGHPAVHPERERARRPADGELLDRRRAGSR